MLETALGLMAVGGGVEGGAGRGIGCRLLGDCELGIDGTGGRDGNVGLVLVVVVVGVGDNGMGGGEVRGGPERGVGAVELDALLVLVMVVVLAVVMVGVPYRPRLKIEELGPVGATAVLDVLDELSALSELAALDELGEFKGLVDCTSHANRLVASIAATGDLMGNVPDALDVLEVLDEGESTGTVYCGLHFDFSSII